MFGNKHCNCCYCRLRRACSANIFLGHVFSYCRQLLYLTVSLDSHCSCSSAALQICAIQTNSFDKLPTHRQTNVLVHTTHGGFDCLYLLQECYFDNNVLVQIISIDGTIRLRKTSIILGFLDLWRLLGVGRGCVVFYFLG